MVKLGYGDVTPQSPTGRAIFVVWGLLGIGTMTILFTVLSDAYEARYSSAVQNRVFEKAVKHFNNRPHSHRSIGPITALNSFPQPSSTTPDFVDKEAQDGDLTLPDGLRKEVKRVVICDEPETINPVVESEKKVGPDQHVSLDMSRLLVNRKQLDNLPTELLEHARSFHDHMEYFNGFDLQGKGNSSKFWYILRLH